MWEKVRVSLIEFHLSRTPSDGLAIQADTRGPFQAPNKPEPICTQYRMRGSFIPSQSINLLFRYSCFLASAFYSRAISQFREFLLRLPRVVLFLGGAPVAAFKSLPPTKMQKWPFPPRSWPEYFRTRMTSKSPPH